MRCLSVVNSRRARDARSAGDRRAPLRSRSSPVRLAGSARTPAHNSHPNARPPRAITAHPARQMHTIRARSDSSVMVQSLPRPSAGLMRWSCGLSGAPQTALGVELVLIGHVVEVEQRAVLDGVQEPLVSERLIELGHARIARL